MSADAVLERERHGGNRASDSGFIAAIRRIPVRFREKRFWRVQGLVFLATAAHYFIETSGYVNPYETLHSLAISLYIFPLVYAALSYGWEGTFLTALWAVALTSPSTWIWHHDELHWLGEVGQVSVTLLVGLVVAWRVEREASERRRAERTSGELSLLNEVAGMLSYTLDVENELRQVMRRLADGMGLGTVWVCLEAEEPAAAPTIQVEGELAEIEDQKRLLDLDFALKSGREPCLAEGRLFVVRLLAEGRMLGSLGVSLDGRDLLGEEQRNLLLTVGAQLGAALENGRLYRRRQESLKSYAWEVTRAQEDERLRIARDLHDETAQALVQILRKLEELRRTAREDQLPTVDELLADTGEELHFIRQFARDLRPPVLDVLGLPAALEVLVNELNGRLRGGAALVVAGTRRRLDRSVELALFRIVQEALRNAEKHGSPTSAQVGLRFEESMVRLEVSDNGRGFTAPANTGDLAAVGRLGLLGMRERAELIGATFQVVSAPGAGTRIIVELPSDARADAQPAG